MKKRSFKDFLALKESNEGPRKTSNDRKLEKGQEFIVDRYNYPQLVPLIRAFKESKGVRIGDFIPGGYLTAKTDGGTEEPKLKAKSLYLVGGAVRDHLLGRKPRDLDLVTDATPSEIRMILLANGFTETTKGGKEKEENIKTPKGITQDPSKKFYIKDNDGDNEISFGIKIKNSPEMKLSTFREESKGGIKGMTVTDLDGDSKKRDLTINSLYLQLDNPDGGNTKLIDPHGGITHMMGGKGKTNVNFIGKASERLKESPLSAFRYIRFYSKYGKGSVTGIPDRYKDEFDKLTKKGFNGISKEDLREEFLKGLEDEDIDPKKYIRLYRELGALDILFPHMTFKLDTYEDFSDEKDRLLAVAWILRKNNPEDIEEMLKGSGWPNEEVKKVSYLLRYLKFNPDIDPEDLIRLYNDNPWPGEYSNDGGRLEKWARMNGMPLKHLKGFQKYIKEPSIQIHTDNGDVAEKFKDLIDPITQILNVPSAVGRRNELEIGRLGKIMKALQNLNT